MDFRRGREGLEAGPRGRAWAYLGAGAGAGAE